jgi:hypothetical protein
MSYLKQVALVNVEGLFSPAPAASYAKKVEIVQFLNPDGTVWTPVPAPVEPLKVVTKTTTTGEAVVGKKLTGTLATYEGGAEPVQELYQWQRSDTGDGGWSGITNWADTETNSSYTTVAADKNKYVRFASKAIDADDVTAYGSGNNVGPITAPPLIISDPTILTNGIFSNPPNVYAFETISMHGAVFAGGYGTISEKYRVQEQPGGVGDWVDLAGWQLGIPTYDVSQSAPGDKLRFSTQGKDSLGTQKTSNSPASTVGVATEIGTVTIAPPNTAGSPGSIITYDVLISGDADPMYIWSIRTGPGAIISPSNIGQEIEVRVNADATPGDSIQVQVTCTDPSASDNGVGAVATIVVN